MGALTGKTPAQTYKDLLQVSNNNSGVDSTTRTVEDGEGTNSAMQVSTNQLRVKPAANNTSAFEVQNAAGTTLFVVDTTDGIIEAKSGFKFKGDGSLISLVTGTAGESSTTALNLTADSGSTGTDGYDIVFKIGSKEVFRIPNAYAQGLPTGIAGNYVLKTVADGWASPVGGAILNGSTQYYSHANNANLNFGTGDFTIEAYFKTGDDVNSVQYISHKFSTNGFILRLQSSSLSVVLGDGTSSTIIPTFTFLPNTNYYLQCAFDRDGNLTVKINNILVNTTSISARSASISNTATMQIGALSSTSFFKGTIYFIKYHNRLFTDSEVTAHWNNGQPDKFVEPFATRDASNTVLTSGILVIGKQYKITTFVAGDDFTNVATVISGTINTTGCVFIAKATTPTTWTNSSELMTQGSTFSALPQDAGTNGWKVKVGGVTSIMNSTASPIATSKGACEVYTDARATIATATPTTMQIPKGYVIKEIRALGSAGLTAIKIGTSSSGEQIVASTTTTGTTPKILTLASTAKASYSESADTTIYVEHTTAGQTMNVILIFEKVGA